jgi:lipoic acid synthetase
MRLPEWIKSETVAVSGFHNHSTKRLLRNHRLSSVCEEARCPNRAYCFSKPTAAFMILGDVCTRDCAFCAVALGAPPEISRKEPSKIVNAVREMGLRYVVITSVTRDDLPDGGAAHFAAVITALHRDLPDVKIEVLTPDFKGDAEALSTVIEAGPDVFNHNMETVKRLYPGIRPQAVYTRSLEVIRTAKKIAPHLKTKSGFMLGLGETIDEVMELLNDLRDTGCDLLTIGQYLRPTKKNVPVVEYINPCVFDDLKQKALALGFSYVASGPLVRSSMNAEELYNYKNK